MITPRITVPTLLDGNWDTAIIFTYGADLSFYERDLLRQIESAKNRIVFADARQVMRKLAETEVRNTLRHINRTYVLAPITCSGAAHAKLILLLREDAGLLAIGSGNLGMDGYASQGECFTTYRWSEDDQGQQTAFVATKQFLDQLSERGIVDPLVKPRVQQAWQDAPWLYASGDEDGVSVRHNLDQPLIDQLLKTIDGRHVEELTIHAPFYDHTCKALAKLLAGTSPKRLKLLLQDRITSVDPERLQRVLDSFDGAVDIRVVEAEERGTFLHAKFIIARLRSAAVCLQGSPNISTPALLETHTTGNIELANLLEGSRTDFDHLVNGLHVSKKHSDLTHVELGLAESDEDEAKFAATTKVSEFALLAHQLRGVFDRLVTTPPEMWIGEDRARDVSWTLEPQADGTTRFGVALGDESAALLARVAAVTFEFSDGSESAPTFPYHLNHLIALSSGQGRTDLLKQAGDFDLDDEELEQLLAQLDEVLIVDGTSLWRMLRKPLPEPEQNGEDPHLAYDDLDWDAIQSHPKLAQYRSWDQRSSLDPTGLGILLSSIAERFRSDVDRLRNDGAGDPERADQEAQTPLGKETEAEDEELAEELGAERDRRRLSARGRARRQFTSFVKRFVGGITDENFVRLVGPSVIVPSYVIFTHICWKLVQAELADPMFIVTSQNALWDFFWGSNGQPGYLDQLTQPEQEAALDILGRHHAEAVLLCSMVQAYSSTWHGGGEDDVAAVRDALRVILQHPLWQPTSDAVHDAATMLKSRFPIPEEMVDELHGLASFETASAPISFLEQELNLPKGSVTRTEDRVSRGALGTEVVEIFVIDHPDAHLSPGSAERILRGLRSILSGEDHPYIRVKAVAEGSVTFADFETDDYVLVDSSNDVVDLSVPDAAAPSWQHGMDDLYRLAS